MSVRIVRILSHHSREVKSFFQPVRLPVADLAWYPCLDPSGHIVLLVCRRVQCNPVTFCRRVKCNWVMTPRLIMLGDVGPPRRVVSCSAAGSHPVLFRTAAA